MSLGGVAGAAVTIALIGVLWWWPHSEVVYRSDQPPTGIDADFGIASVTVDATEWTDEGVRVRFNSGHELFIPARLFEYGR